MALIIPNLERDIKRAFKAASKSNGKAAEDIIAKRLAIAIDKYIRAGTVNTVVGTTGGAGTGVGAIS
tara:strand:+ start:253 stop:453 length:201 start_codon:yes stop_codon:yes gene_type:complete